MTDIFEDLFGKAPEKGYEFTSVDVNVFDYEITPEQHDGDFVGHHKGLVVSWAATGIGFGEITLNIKEDKIEIDSECMSKEFVKALLEFALPKIWEKCTITS